MRSQGISKRPNKKSKARRDWRRTGLGRANKEEPSNNSPLRAPSGSRQDEKTISAASATGKAGGLSGIKRTAEACAEREK
jgi:hypothetical protein